MPDHKSFGPQDMRDLLAKIYAPWVQALNITPMERTPTGYRFLLPKSTDLVRDGDVVCGQALAAIADSVGALSLSAHNGGFRNMTTVDLSIHFMRPLFLGDIQAEVFNLSSGRRLATTRIDMKQVDASKLGASATCVYAYLE